MAIYMPPQEPDAGLFGVYIETDGGRCTWEKFTSLRAARACFDFGWAMPTTRRAELQEIDEAGEPLDMIECGSRGRST